MANMDPDGQETTNFPWLKTRAAKTMIAHQLGCEVSEISEVLGIHLTVMRGAFLKFLCKATFKKTVDGSQEALEQSVEFVLRKEKNNYDVQNYKRDFAVYAEINRAIRQSFEGLPFKDMVPELLYSTGVQATFVDHDVTEEGAGFFAYRHLPLDGFEPVLGDFSEHHLTSAITAIAYFHAGTNALLQLDDFKRLTESEEAFEKAVYFESSGRNGREVKMKKDSLLAIGLQLSVNNHELSEEFNEIKDAVMPAVARLAKKTLGLMCMALFKCDRQSFGFKRVQGDAAADTDEANLQCGFLKMDMVGIANPGVDLLMTLSECKAGTLTRENILRHIITYVQHFKSAYSRLMKRHPSISPLPANFSALFSALVMAQYLIPAVERTFSLVLASIMDYPANLDVQELHSFVNSEKSRSGLPNGGLFDMKRGLERKFSTDPVFANEFVSCVKDLCETYKESLLYEQILNAPDID